MDSVYMTTAEAAEFLRVTSRTILRWENAGLIKALRPTRDKKPGGGTVLFRKDQLIQFVEGQPITLVAEPAPKQRGRPRKTEAA
jgi:excisionase family DNA binding protein